MNIKTFFYKFIAKLTGKNLKITPPNVIIDQMNEKRPLPVGMAEFEVWSDRIISGCLLPAESESMKFALATMLLHLKPTEDHCEDAYFIHSLRKSAVNQIAHAKMQEIKEAAQARMVAKTKETVVSAIEETRKSIHLIDSDTQKNGA